MDPWMLGLIPAMGLLATAVCFRFVDGWKHASRMVEARHMAEAARYEHFRELGGRGGRARAAAQERASRPRPKDEGDEEEDGIEVSDPAVTFIDGLLSNVPGIDRDKFWAGDAGEQQKLLTILQSTQKPQQAQNYL